jgi:hypothetical protein
MSENAHVAAIKREIFEHTNPDTHVILRNTNALADQLAGAEADRKLWQENAKTSSRESARLHQIALDDRETINTLADRLAEAEAQFSEWKEAALRQAEQTLALTRQLAGAEALGKVVANDRLICGERLAEAEARVHELEQRIREAMVAASEIQLFDVGYPEQGWVEFDVESWLEDYLHPGDLPDTDGGTT